MTELKMMIAILLVLLIQICSAQTSGWTEQESGTDAQLNEIFFIDSETGWAVGDAIILATTDGGESWTVQDSSDVFFRSVFFTDTNHGWAVGFPNDLSIGVIYQTTDAGLHWHAQDSAEVDLQDIYFADADTGFICGGSGTNSLILKTTNGGTTWEINLDASYGTLSAIHFSDLKHGWAVGFKGLVMMTENSGKIWNRRIPNLDVGYTYIYDVQFLNQDMGWSLGAGYLFNTTDGGENWDSKSDPDYYLYTSLHFYNVQTGWLLAGYKEHFFTNEILHTSDGGLTWQVQPSTQSDNMTSLYFIDDKIGWITGFNGLILKTTNGGVTSMNENFRQVWKYDLSQNYPNPFNPLTIINYELPITNYVELSIYNLLGQKIALLVSEKQPAGKYQVEWEASRFAAGVYYYQLKTDSYQRVKKMVLIK